MDNLEIQGLQVNLTPEQRAYFDILKAELLELFGGRDYETIKKSGDVEALKKVSAKLGQLEEFLRTKKISSTVLREFVEQRFRSWIEPLIVIENWDIWCGGNVRFNKDEVVMIGNWDFSRKLIREIPVERLKISGGSLCLNECSLLRLLPEELSVDFELLLRGCVGLKRLPQKLIVGANLDIVGCEALKALPEDIRVNGKVYIDKARTDLLAQAEKLHNAGKIGEVVPT